MLLEALRVPVDMHCQSIFWQAVDRFANIEDVFDRLCFRSWGWFFPPEPEDVLELYSKVFIVVAGLVQFREVVPCPRCQHAMHFERDCSRIGNCRRRVADAVVHWRPRTTPGTVLVLLVTLRACTT